MAEMARAAYQCKERLKEQNKENQQRFCSREQAKKVADGWEPGKKWKVGDVIAFINLTCFFSANS